MPDIMMRLGRDMLVFEGAMGTMLQRAGLLVSDGAPEALNLIEPEAVTAIHRDYALAGANCAISNTFGASAPKLAEYGLADQVVQINRAGVKIARAGGAPHVLADIGPTGLVMAPIGAATFDEIYDAFFQQASALASERPDAFLLETFTDIAEIRAAVIACRDADESIPVIASITVNTEGRMELSGTDPATAAILLEAAGADAVGMNCGLGPDQMKPHIEHMVRATRLPVIVQPNAGLPHVDLAGATVFPGTPDEMGTFALAAFEAGAAAVGSCCGSTPAFTGAIADEINHRDPVEVYGRGFEKPVVAGPRGFVVIGSGDVKIIGECINPTGKTTLSQQLAQGVFTEALRLAQKQESQGAHLLDVNVGLAGIDEVQVLPALITALCQATNLPLVIDTSDIDALEAALRIYPGRALINSVNGDPQNYPRVFAAAKRYGACLIALALDDRGIPDTVKGRMEVIDAVRLHAREEGISEDRLVIDALVMTRAVDPQAPEVTLATMQAVREAGLATVLGISNVSFGMAGRAQANAAFFAQAVELGLDAAIVNPAELDRLHDADEAASSAVVDISSLSMDELAQKFKSGEIFLPQLMLAIDALKERAAQRQHNGGDSKETVVFATVQGDIHSIGKDICIALLESQGYEVIDMGVDVAAERIVEQAREAQPVAVCLSALMTTTLPHMQRTIDMMRAALPDIPVCVGGAVVTQAWSDRAEVHYSADAPTCVALVDSLERKGS